MKIWHIYDDICEVYYFDRYIIGILDILQYLSQFFIVFNVFRFVLKIKYRAMLNNAIFGEINLTRAYNSCGLWNPQNPQKPLPLPAKTRTRDAGTGFWRVRVRVAVEYPRVTRASP